MTLADNPPVVFVLTADHRAAAAFYRDTLGLRMTGEDEYAASFDFAGTLMRLTTVPDHKPHPHTVLGWQVDDIEASVDALTARGVTFAHYEGFGQDARGIWSAPDRSVRIAWFHDGEGNNLSLTQR